ncbi:uncharacterized protein boss isoform X2 [Cherax quadricarinatus]|uniref:uncharacterized protein boss isoform X2 n=1 Tax=Cherax quadricarinatus TaxID=27406 RepID=UPI00387E325F
MQECRVAPGRLVLTTVALLHVGTAVALWGSAADSSGPQASTCPSQRTFPATVSDIYVTGVLGVSGGVRCDQMDPSGAQLLEAARWTALKMTNMNIIPGLTLGVSAYDTCGGPQAVLRAAVTAVVDGGYLDSPRCRAEPHVGVLHSHPHHAHLSAFLKDLDIASVSVGSEDQVPQLEALMQLLVRLNWTSVAVAAPSIQVLQQFGHLAAQSRVCVGAEAILPPPTSNNLYESLVEDLGRNGPRGMVLIGPQDHLQAALLTAAHNYTNLHWVLAPTGPIQESVFQGMHGVSGALVVRRDSQTVPEFGEHFLSVTASDTTLYPPVTHHHYTEEPAVFQVVKAMYTIGLAVRRAVVHTCGGTGWCKNASVTFTAITDDSPDVIEAFSIKAERPRYQVLRLSPLHTSNPKRLVFSKVRSCRGSAQEGSQGFSLLLLMSCVFLYAAILPYSFEASTLTCSLRPFATSLAYAIVFAIMLSRSLMLATADSEGLVGHVSGVIQTALLFFMVSVQAGLGVQQWLMASQISMHSLPSGGALYTCSPHRLHFIISQSYIMFLLALQLIISPFNIRSRRNYHEGLLFFIATLLMTSVWIAWSTLYMILPPAWSEACICLGMAATSTCVLVTIFVPKTYLMVRAAARDSVCAAPVHPLARPQSTHDLARSSSLALYDSVGYLPEMIQAPGHAYAPDPTVHHPTQKENPYETYSQYHPSPHKITQF